MTDKLTVAFHEQVRVADDPKRAFSVLERATKAAIKQIQDWVNTYAPVAARSAFAYVKVKESGNLQEADCNVYDVYADAALSLTMPAHKQSRLVVVKDGGGNAGTFNITLKRLGSAGTINGVEGDYVISNNNEYVWLISDGDNKNWRRITYG